MAPCVSRELKPIERARAHGMAIAGMSYNVIAAEKAWAAVGEDYLWKLMESMPKRCWDVIRARGYYTKILSG